MRTTEHVACSIHAQRSHQVPRRGAGTAYGELECPRSITNLRRRRPESHIVWLVRSKKKKAFKGDLRKTIDVHGSHIVQDDLRSRIARKSRSGTTHQARTDGFQDPYDAS